MSDKYWYLAGPMTGIKQMNFPAFLEIAEALRTQSWNIVSPAEIDKPETREASLASDTGAQSDLPEPFSALIARDVEIVSHEDCMGVIVMDGWLGSTGAKIEAFVAHSLGKPIRKVERKGSHYVVLDQIRDPMRGIFAAISAKKVRYA